MARFWSEPYDPAKHHGPMPGSHRPTDDDLVRRFVYFVRVCSFTFEFHTLDQIQTCLAYFSEKTHPSSIIPRSELIRWGGDQHETQRWFERLPPWLFEEPKRQKVLRALHRAIAEFLG